MASITPAISVLSALEGLNEATASFKPLVMPMAVAILVGLFATQRFGTETIGRAFGPVMLAWFFVIALLGAAAIARHPAVLAAVDPRYAVVYLAHAGAGGILVLGGVFLCITGGEALYADMGHFGKQSIRRSWYFIVLPALLLSYAGQTAFMLGRAAARVIRSSSLRRAGLCIRWWCWPRSPPSSPARPSSPAPSR